ncbi:hypothetical protein BBJ28_00018026 [Nothophytophthora sp. Chile5]|nr:hypothetical protein BBJ28_00018026 [Nothophytophthora sp. Chile5]
MGPDLVRKESEEALQLEVLVKLGVPDFAWAPKYIFPMTLVAQEPPPSDPQSPDRLDRLTTQVQDLQQEVKTLKAQMQAVLRSRAPSQPTAEPSSPSSTSGSSPSASPGRSPAPSPAPNPTENGSEAATVTPSRKDQVWGDIIGHPQHQLLQTADYRETRNSFGVMVRKHRQRSCKVCSVLRGDRKRAFETSYYCVECTERHKGAIVFLCDKVRPHDADEYRNATCSQIWHVMWNNGADIPHGGISSIRMRKKLKTGDVDGGDANAFPADMARPSRGASR